MNPKGTYDLAVGCVQQAVTPFVVAGGASKLSLSKQIIYLRDRLRKNKVIYNIRIKFVKEGKILPMVCDLMEYDIKKFREHTLEKINKEYYKAKGMIERELLRKSLRIHT